jgi:hypothetical protein
MSSLKEEGSGRTPEEIAEHYRPAFPKELPHSEKIIATALATPLKNPQLLERLILAYSQSENRGNLDQLYTAVAIKDIFTHDAQNTPVGSFDNALCQTLFTRVLSENDSSLRKARTQALFQMMEEGSLSRSKMESFFKEWGYEKSFRPKVFPRFSFAFWRSQSGPALEALKGYRFADKALLLNFIFSMEEKKPETTERIFKIFKEARHSERYPAEALDGALSYARRHPAGVLVLRRLLHLLAVEDAPAKLLELQGPVDERNTLLYIAEMANQGKSWENISEAINGSRHTAYFDDLRLARKIVATSLEVHPRLIGKTEERGLFRARLYEAMNSFLLSGKKLDAEQLIRLLEVNGEEELVRFHRQWSEKKFDFEVVSAELFNHIVKVYGQIPDCEESIFIPLAGAKQRNYLAKKLPPPGQAILRQEYERFLNRLGERDQILIRELPPGILKSPLAKEAAFRNLRFRLWGLLHEWGHFLHHSGSDEAIRKEEGPISLANINRQNRLITEIWAYLQEQPWRTKNIDIDPWILGERLGENFSLYLRHLNDQSYFGKVNEKLMGEAGLQKEP